MESPGRGPTSKRALPGLPSRCRLEKTRYRLAVLVTAGTRETQVIRRPQRARHQWEFLELLFLSLCLRSLTQMRPHASSFRLPVASLSLNSCPGTVRPVARACARVLLVPGGRDLFFLPTPHCSHWALLPISLPVPSLWLSCLPSCVAPKAGFFLYPPTLLSHHGWR